MMLSELRSLQDDIYHRLKAEDAFRYVQIMLVRPRDANEAVLIEKAIQEGLAGLVYVDNQTSNGGGSDDDKAAAIATNGKAGISIEVLTPDGEVNEPNLPGPQLEAVSHLRVCENPLVNFGERGTQIEAEQASQNVLSTLHLWQRGTQTVTADTRAIREMQTESGIEFHVVLRQKLNAPKQLRTNAPALAYADGNVTLTSGTDGAAIYYTTDGSAPAISNAAAQLYAAPFAADTGTLIRAAAFSTGRLGSAITQKTLV